MRLVRTAIALLGITAFAWLAVGAELTADDVVDRMLAANSAWLRVDTITHVSYVVERLDDGKRPPEGATTRVFYRAPRDLRIESEPEHKVIIWRDGRRLPAGHSICRECSASYLRDVALAHLVFRGGLWALANYRDECKASDLRHERVDGRNAYHIRVEGHSAPYFPLGGAPSPSDCHDWRELWIDAENFQPLREAWDDGCTGPPYYRVVRYADYQPFADGGEAPMRLEFARMWPEDLSFAADFPREPSIHHCQVVAAKYWLRRPEAVHDLSVDPVPESLFTDEALVAQLQRVEELYAEMRALKAEKRWEALYRAYEEFNALDPGGYRLPRSAFYLYFWHGEYEKALSAMPSGTYNVYVAWAYDALGEREEALDAYRALAPEHIDPALVPPEIPRGLQGPWIPIGKRLDEAANEQLLTPSPGWSATTNAGGATPEAAIDGSRRTRWTSADTQHPGMWFQMDLGEPTRLSRIAFDFVGDLSLDFRDFPRDYVLEVSLDGIRWSVVAKGQSPLDNLVNAALEAREVRYVRMRQEWLAERARWSINEILLYAPK